MLDFVDSYFHSLACTMALPKTLDTAGNTTLASPTPHSHSKARTDRLSKPLRPTLCVSQNLPCTPIQKKRGRKRDFTIFVDFNTEYVPFGPSTQRTKANVLAPLLIRTGSANSTPAPSPRTPNTPVLLSPTDPLWFDKENWDPSPIITPQPIPAAFPHDSSAANSTSPPPTQTARVIRPRTRTILPPRNLVLYDILGLRNWRASRAEIRSAWRRTALEVHPDQAAEDEQEAATQRMQRVNAAREVLLNATRRRQYHDDGVLPWAL
jgi:hypothetical protein